MTDVGRRPVAHVFVLVFPLQVFTEKVKYKPVSIVSGERHGHLYRLSLIRNFILVAPNPFEGKSLLPLALSRGSDEPLWVNLHLWELPPQYPVTMLSVI